MRRPIARIKINAGNPGWYDPLTNIHLTISRPEAIVFEGANTTNIKKGVAYKLISVIDGDLDINVVSVENKEEKETVNLVREVVSKPVVETTEPVKETTEIKEKVVKTKKVEEAVKEEITVEEEVTEEVAIKEEEETAEEKVEEKPKKKTTKKKTTKKEN